MLEHVLATLAYTDQFAYPLSFDEIKLRLLRHKMTEGWSDKQLFSVLNNLLSKKLIVVDQGRYALSGRESLFQVRRQQEEFATAKWREVDEFISFVKWIPWVQAVAITGSLAMNVAKKNDDIDFMIITQQRRLWLARILVTIFAWWKGKRRSWKQEEENSWCFNLWLGENKLGVPQKKRSIYGAYEVCQAKFVFDRADIERKFLRANDWVKNILPNYFFSRWQVLDKNGKDSNNWLWIIDPELDLFEELAFILQYRYMKSHMTTEIVDKNIAFFHPRDTKGQIMKNWQSSLKRLE